ncbi:MAG: histidinol-phosphatase HisJ family protein [Bacteroidota bacterium]
MLRHDFHLHSHFSEECVDEPRAYCLRAIEGGYQAICFTDHATVDRSLLCRDPSAYERYRRSVLACREEFSGRLAVGFGVEIGYHHSVEDKIRTFLEGKQFDYILGSVHHLGDTDVTHEAYFAGKTQRQAYEPYFAEVLRLAESGLCQGLAHLDVVERRGAQIYGPFDALAYQDCLRPILAAAVRHGLALEINLSAYSYNREPRRPSPGLDVLALYLEEGGRLITIGSDGHKPVRILPERVDVWDFVERHDFILWEPSPGFWTRGAATGFADDVV